MATNVLFRNSVNPNFGFNRLSIGNPFYVIQNNYIAQPRYSTITYAIQKPQLVTQYVLSDNKIGLKTNPKAPPMTNTFNLNTAAVKSEKKYNPYYNTNNYPQRVDNVKDLMNYTYSERVPRFPIKSNNPNVTSFTPYVANFGKNINNQTSYTPYTKIPNSSRIPKINENTYNSLINNFRDNIDNNQIINNEQIMDGIQIKNESINKLILNDNKLNNQYSKKAQEINNAFLSADVRLSTSNNINNLNSNNIILEEIVSDNNSKEYFRECKGGLVKHYGYYEDLGSRPYMEDQGISIQNFNGDPNQILFCIFDGHGGGEVSKFLQENFGEYMKKMLPIKDYPKDFSELFAELDNKINSLNVPDAGSTATVAYIEKLTGKRVLHVASVGDSRCVLVKKDRTLRLSVDDRVEDPNERQRIIKQGGIIFNGRIIGQLMLSRCFGDWGIKEYGVIVNPHLATVDLSDEDLFLVIGSDGVWDVIRDEELKELTKSNANSLEISKNIIVEAIKRGSEDNISCFVIRL
jgi:serine/threonine protein phosphatase PrpC